MGLQSGHLHDKLNVSCLPVDRFASGGEVPPFTPRGNHHVSAKTIFHPLTIITCGDNRQLLISLGQDHIYTGNWVFVKVNHYTRCSVLLASSDTTNHRHGNNEQQNTQKYSAFQANCSLLWNLSARLKNLSSLLDGR